MSSPSSTVLVSAFEPFGGDTINASREAVLPLEGRLIAGHRVVTVVLPCVFGGAIDAMSAALARTAPKLVVACGEAASRTAIGVERVARNVEDARIPDNAGAQPIDRPVVAGGPAAYFATLPIEAIVAARRERGLPAEVSESAGTFVCNLFFGLMHALAAPGTPRAGFVHVPRPPAMSTAAVTQALEVVVATALTTSADGASRLGE